MDLDRDTRARAKQSQPWHNWLPGWARICAIINLSKTLHLIAYDRLLMEIAASGLDFNVSFLHHRKIWLSLSTYDVKVCSLLYDLLHQFSQFPFPMEHFKLRKQKMAEFLSMDHHRVPWKDRWAIHGNVHSVTNCQYCTMFSFCYSSANVSTPV
jgi:hypothetical protein